MVNSPSLFLMIDGNGRAMLNSEPEAQVSNLRGEAADW